MTDINDKSLKQNEVKRLSYLNYATGYYLPMTFYTIMDNQQDLVL